MTRPETEALPRLLVVGSRGRLGRAVCRIVEDEQADVFPAAVFATRDELDITDYFRLRSELERIEPNLVINCAAYAHVDGCETHRELAQRVNVEGAAHLARAARAVGARLLHVSTDLVFDGSAAPHLYGEEDEPHPLSHYAATKLAGEAAVRQQNPDSVVLRSSWFFGPWPADRYPEAFLRMMQRGQRFRMVSDRIGSPTYLADLARAILKLARLPHSGLVHFANTGEPTSRYGLLKALAERLGIDPGPMAPVTDAEWGEDAAMRPRFSALDSSLYERLTGQRPRTWRESLEEYAVERAS